MDPEGPASQATNLQRRISILRSETRRVGDNYSKVELGLERDLEPGETYEQGYQYSLGFIEHELHEALSQVVPELQKPDTPKPVPSQQITSEDRYADLPWRQSQKKSNLATIRVTSELLGSNPVAKELFDRLKEFQSLRVLKTTYKLGRTPDGTEFLQKWSGQQIGG